MVNSFIIVLTLGISCTMASDNGKYYICDTSKLESDNECIFVFNGEQPEDWIQEPISHDINRDVGADFYRGVQSYDGETMLSLSPKPWVNGDSLVASDDFITGELWVYTLIFELIAPLRDMMMYNPSELTEEVWKKYTRALTDCNSKTEDYVATRSGGTPWSTDQVYEYLKDPNGKDIHHYILQYLEEGAIDLVCLSTDLEMEHCDGIRQVANATEGDDHCNCWFDAYKALYDECPKFDMIFTACPGTTASVDCANEQPIDTSNLGTANPEIPTTVQPEQPIVTSGVPPAGGPDGSLGGPKGRRLLML